MVRRQLEILQHQPCFISEIKSEKSKEEYQEWYHTNLSESHSTLRPRSMLYHEENHNKNLLRKE